MKKKIVKAAARAELSHYTVHQDNIDALLAALSPAGPDPEFLVVDLFCGAGGTSTGFERTSAGTAKVIACVNHDAMAILSHWRNHPGVLHFEEDIRHLDLSLLARVVQHWQRIYPKANLILWASLECTNFSNAKGGQPRDADSRTLAEHLHRYITALDPDYIQIENVVEFMSWGPLDAKGKPLSRRRGADYLRWCSEVDAHGYRNEWREMNSADYGAYTSRNRLFGCFAKQGLPIIWPEPTHCKAGRRGLMGNLQPWKAVREVLDLEDHGRSIFREGASYSPKTLERIYAGLVKYVAGGERRWLLKYNSTTRDGVHVPPPLSAPCPVVAAQSRLGIITAEPVTFLSRYYGGNPEFRDIDLSMPAGTIRTNDGHHLINATFLSKYYSGNPNSMNLPVDGPAGTFTTTDSHALINACFLSQYYGSGYNSGTDHPAPTLTTKDRCALIQPQWVDRQYGSGPSNHHSLDVPSGTLLANPHSALMTVMPTNFSNEPQSIEQLCPTITANRKWHYMLVFQSGRYQPKLIIDRTAIGARIRSFMAAYGIADIKMRMLKVPELLRIQGFPAGYDLAGTQTDQKKFIGNSVVPNVVTAWAEAMAGRIRSQRQTAVE